MMKGTNGGKRGKLLGALELSAFCDELALLLSAGVSPSEGMASLAEEAESGEEKELFRGLYEALEAGDTLEQALRQAGRFPDYLTGMVGVGERTGRLPQVAQALASYYRREGELLQNIRYAAVYPCVMGLVVAGVIFVLAGKVLPVFSQVYRELGRDVPGIVQGLLSVGSAVERYAVLFAVLFAFLTAAFLILCFAPGAEERLSALFARGKLGRELSAGRFSFAMSLMMDSGMEVLDSVRRAGELAQSAGFRSMAEECAKELEAGVPFPKAVRDAGIYTGMDLSLISAGFRAGQPAEAMSQIAGRGEEAAHDRLDRMVGRVEPILITVLCLVVGLVLLSVMLPLIGVLGAIG